MACITSRVHSSQDAVLITIQFQINRIRSGQLTCRVAPALIANDGILKVILPSTI